MSHHILVDSVEHNCLLEENYKIPQFKCNHEKWIYGFLLISNKHPSSTKKFRSRCKLRNEKKQQVFHTNWFNIHPFSKLALYFDIIMAPLSSFTLFAIIFMNAFHEELYEWSYFDEMIAIYSVIIISCLMDILFNLFTGYYNGVVVVLDLINIALRYSKRYLIIDGVTFIACIQLCATIQNKNLTVSVPKNLMLIKLLSLPRLFKYISILIEHYGISDIGHRIIRLLLTAIILTHLSSCLYKTAYQFFFQKGDWTETDFLFNTSMNPFVKYERIIYIVSWRIFASSFGNHVPTQKLAQKFVGLMSMIVGFLFHIHLIIQIFHIIETRNATKRKYHEVINQLNAYMCIKKFPMKLQERLNYFYNKKFNKSFFQENAILNTLSKPLRAEVTIHRGRLFIDKIKLFHGISELTIKSLVACLKFNAFLPSDMIIKTGSYGNCMFFIGLGTVAIITKNGKEICHLYDGDHFGEFSLVMHDRRRKTNVVAIDYSEVYELDIDDYEQTIVKSPELIKKMEDVILQRLDMLLTEDEHHKNEIRIDL